MALICRGGLDCLELGRRISTVTKARRETFFLLYRFSGLTSASPLAVSPIRLACV